MNDSPDVLIAKELIEQAVTHAFELGLTKREIDATVDAIYSTLLVGEVGAKYQLP